MKALLKKKLDLVVNEVKAHPGLYGYVAGCLVTGIGTAIVVHFAMKDGPLVDMEAAANRILDEGFSGLYWETSKGTMIAFLNETLETPLTDFK